MLSNSAKDLLVNLLTTLGKQADEKVPATRISLFLNDILVGHLKSRESRFSQENIPFYRA